MYGYEQHLEISPEQLLQKITQEEIFEHILKEPFNFGSRYCSPLRDDKNPGCRFEQRPDGVIVFVDFGEKNLTGHTHRSCFGMIMDAFNVTIDGAIRIICSEFRLSTNIQDYGEVRKIKYEKSDTQPANISYEKRIIPLKSDIIYWSQYQIKMEHLKEDDTFCVSKFNIKNTRGSFTIHTFKHCYAFDFFPKVKIYQPYKDKHKWSSSCDENCIGNHDNLPPTGKRLIIQKSYKDHRVVRNNIEGSNVVWFQNEGCIPDINILRSYTERFEEIIIFYDNDDDGRIAAQKLVDIFNLLKEGCARMVELPRKRKHKKLYGSYLKDPSDFLKREGKQDLLTVFKQIGLYGRDT